MGKRILKKFKNLKSNLTGSLPDDVFPKSKNLDEADILLEDGIDLEEYLCPPGSWDFSDPDTINCKTPERIVRLALIDYPEKECSNFDKNYLDSLNSKYKNHNLNVHKIGLGALNRDIAFLIVEKDGIRENLNDELFKDKNFSLWIEENKDPCTIYKKREDFDNSIL